MGENKNMNISTSKKTKSVTLLTTILLLTSILITAISIQAQSDPDVEGYPDLKPLPAGVTPDYTHETTAYLSFRPTLVGVGQSVLVNMWTTPGMYHAFYMCDYKVTI